MYNSSVSLKRLDTIGIQYRFIIDNDHILQVRSTSIGNREMGAD